MPLIIQYNVTFVYLKKKLSACLCVVTEEKIKMHPLFCESASIKVWHYVSSLRRSSMHWTPKIVRKRNVHAQTTLWACLCRWRHCDAPNTFFPLPYDVAPNNFFPLWQEHFPILPYLWGILPCMNGLARLVCATREFYYQSIYLSIGERNISHSYPSHHEKSKSHYFKEN